MYESANKINIKKIIRKLYYEVFKRFVLFIWNILDTKISWFDGFTPPINLRMRVGPFINPNYFRATGEKYVEWLIERADLRPNQKILDVGCGCGRLAVPLTKYLNKSGAYAGFDVDSKLIYWCKDKVSSKYPNFQFHLFDIFNKNYNPKGVHTEFTLKFPYKDNAFDLVTLGSVFTHMLPQDMENYLSEILRILKNKGRCLITYFLLNDNTLKSIDSGVSTLNFKYVNKCYHTINKEMPEQAVAYDENYILAIYKKKGLSLTKPIYRGTWPRRKTIFYGSSWPLRLWNNFSYQDMIVATKN